jgi:hypothetical protein
MSEIPHNVRWELEDAGVYIDAEKTQLSRELFERFSDPAKTALMRAGFKLYDRVTAREFERAGSLDRAEFLRQGGRVVG